MSREKWIEAWRTLSPSQGAVLIGVLAVVAYLVAHAPAGTWDALASKDPTELGASIALFLLAIGGVFTKGKGAE